MRTTVSALAAVLMVSPSLAGECHYWHYRLPGTISFDESETLVWEILGETTLSCTIVDNRLSRGPFPTMCSDGHEEWEDWYSFYPSPEGDPGALMLFQDEIWYQRCFEPA